MQPLMEISERVCGKMSIERKKCTKKATVEFSLNFYEKKGRQTQTDSVSLLYFFLTFLPRNATKELLPQLIPKVNDICEPAVLKCFENSWQCLNSCWGYKRAK